MTDVSRLALQHNQRTLYTRKPIPHEYNLGFLEKIPLRKLYLCSRSVFCSTWLFLVVVQNALAADFEDDTSKNWTLVGTVVSQPLSKAVFQHSSGTERILIEGEAIADCTIFRIETKIVNMLCKDQHRLLALDYAQGSHTERIRPAIRFAASKEFYSISRNWLSQVVRDRQRLVSQISLVPTSNDGSMIGYRVGGLRPDGDFTDLGLINEDVITAVNGTPANQPEAFIQAVNASALMQVINLEVERGNRLVSINYLLYP